MRLHRFYVKQPLGEELVVGNKELLHQWTSVFRFKPGDQVLLFSSSPSDFLYTFITISKAEATLSFVSKKDNIISEKMVLYMALVKKDTFETIVRQATELGVTRIVPVLASRSEKKNLNFERLETIIKEATEQSGRGDIPLISQILSLKEAIVDSGDSLRVVGSLHGDSFKRGVIETKQAVSLWIGPEGGWTREEEDLFKKNDFTLVMIAPETLRADTAAISLISLARKA
ncbi:MAG: rRNA (uracil1498-N3)-methyltransferase [Patescibacteria group bacterium]|nr:rRNA (uracil1498-N3)-methyltransferase [Patescibacteria group bacterium]